MKNCAQFLINVNNNNDKNNIEESEEYFSQIGDDNLVYMIKKALDEKLENKFFKIFYNFF